MKEFFLCFVPLFVAVDVIGLLPIFFGLTEDLEFSKIRRIILQSILTAMFVSILFLFVGQKIFEILGITLGDFTIAGGILLFGIAMSDLLSMEKKARQVDPQSVGAVPIGVPLIAGPAMLATMVVLSGQYGYLPTILATIGNISLAGAVFFGSGMIIRILGKAGIKTLSKISSLILAAFAVMMVRKGIMTFFENF